MASKKPTPKVSRISRDRTVAYARKQKPGSGSAGDDAEPPEDATPDAASDATDDGAPNTVAQSLYDAAATAAPTDVTASMTPVLPASAPTDATAPMMAMAAAATPTAVTAPMLAVAPAPGGSGAASQVSQASQASQVSDDAPAGERSRARVATVAMPIQASIGGPPAMPAEPAAAAPVIDPTLAEAPTRMPGPREIPGGSPDDPASPPGGVPSGDSRSMRRRTERYEFALIYRMQTYVICRFGAVGTRGQWRVVEYPTSASAAHAYAKEVSRFVSEGFSDYRD
jgi:predicted DNA-binding WGR domain protein